MPPAHDPRIAFAAGEIRRHLREHPHAADTLEGIHQWWIRWPGPLEDMAVTEAALRELENLGEMGRKGAGGALLWKKP